MRIRRLLLLAGLIGSALMASGQDSRMSDRSKEVFKGAVEVSVSRDKHSYKQGEPIWLTAQIKNVDEASVFVFPRTSFEDDGDGVFIVRVTETPKCKFVFTNHAGTPARIMSKVLGNCSNRANPYRRRMSSARSTRPSVRENTR